MNKELKDYLHLYLGCECKVYMPTIDFELPGCITELTINLLNTPFRFKPILRPLSDMTDEESNVTKWIKYSDTGEIRYPPETFVFLLSKHFDLFGLIEAGLAIDKTTLKP